MEKILHGVLEGLRLPNGAYVASNSRHYSLVWVRDTVYAALPYLESDCQRYEKAIQAILDIYRRYEWKIDIHCRKKPICDWEHLHSRYSLGLEELEQPWGHVQNDAIGLFLWSVAEGIRRGKRILRDRKDKEILEKLVSYLSCIEYWNLPDNGMWEEAKEIHTSSIGACIAGLKGISLLVGIPETLIDEGEKTIRQLLPHESAGKDTDLAQLSLIYPLAVVDRKMALTILDNVTSKLEREHGCIRYSGDRYFHEGKEAQWCFGLPWLGLCYGLLGEEEKVLGYWTKTLKIMPANGEIPELYVGGTDKPNENTPLAWAVALAMLLCRRVLKS